jgi:hypothetical protein
MIPTLPHLAVGVLIQRCSLSKKNTKNTHKMSRCIDLPPAASPSLSIESSAMDPNLVAAAPYEPVSGARRTGSGSLWRNPLIGAPQWHPAKN